MKLLTEMINQFSAASSKEEKEMMKVGQIWTFFLQVANLLILINLFYSIFTVVKKNCMLLIDLFMLSLMNYLLMIFFLGVVW